MKQIIKKSFCFIANKAGVVSIEIAFIASSFILLIMGIIEYSVIFSSRAGIEELLRDLSRKRLSVSDGVWINEYNIDMDGILQGANINTALENKIARTITGMLQKNTKASLCTTTYEGTGDILNDNEIQHKCINSVFGRWNHGASLDFGEATEYTKIEIQYQHNFITPIGYIYSSLAGSVNLSTVSYFRRETLFNEDV